MSKQKTRRRLVFVPRSARLKKVKAQSVIATRTAYEAAQGEGFPLPQLSHCGEIVDKWIRALPAQYPEISVDSYVIMPNHIHLLLLLQNEESPVDGPSRTSAPTRQHMAVPRFVSTLKRFCNKEYGTNIFQRSFYDHVIRNYDDYRETGKYIRENPARWFYDDLFTKE